MEDTKYKQGNIAAELWRIVVGMPMENIDYFYTENHALETLACPAMIKVGGRFWGTNNLQDGNLHFVVWSLIVYRHYTQYYYRLYALSMAATIIVIEWILTNLNTICEVGSNPN